MADGDAPAPSGTGARARPYRPSARRGPDREGPRVTNLDYLYVHYMEHAIRAPDLR